MKRKSFLLTLLLTPLTLFGFLNTESPSKGLKGLPNKLNDRSFFKLVPVEFEDLRKGDVFVSVDPPGGHDKGAWFNEVSVECYNSADPGQKPLPTMMTHRREALIELFERKEV